MFNTYQELVDRINELLEEKEKYEKKIKKLEDLYLKIPKRYINDLHFRNVITNEERLFWSILKNRQRKEQENEKNKMG